jgi:hypothetical protein
MLMRTTAAIALTLIITACTQSTDKAQTCESQWSTNSDTAMPHEVRDDPAAKQQYRDRYISICER